MRPRRESGPHVLYRMLDRDGVLLYVGITNNPKGRIANHASDKPWWDSVANISLEHFATRAELELAERAAVADERPIYNMVLKQFSTAWCREQGHVSPNARRCEECRDGAWLDDVRRAEELDERELENEFADDPLIRSYLGINAPAGEQNLTAEEMLNDPALQRFSALCVDMEAELERRRFA